MTKTDSLESTIARLPQATNGKLQVAELLRQYGCGPIPFVGTENAFYERHLIFDRVIDPKVATARERFEAFARSVRDILAQRWVLTKKTYERENAKADLLSFDGVSDRTLHGEQRNQPAT